MQTAWAQKVVLYMEGNQTFECYVSQVDSIKFEEGELTHGITDGHEWVDLGLPSGTLWATCNVGANSPEEYGSYFAWGETMQKSNYYWSTYKYCRGTEDTMTKYCTSSQYGTYGTIDEISELQPMDDAATVNWSSNWQMPSRTQQMELYKECNWTWTTRNGVNGCLFESKINNMSIFLPAGGYCYDLATSYIGSRGYYWSRELRKTIPNQAYCLVSNSDGIGSGFDVRCYGRSVRPVRVQDTTPAKLVTAIVLNNEAIYLQVNETKKLTATITPSDADNPSVSWESSNKSVAKVNNEGLVTAVAEGTCTITCSATDGSGVKAECQVTVKGETASIVGTWEWREGDVYIRVTLNENGTYAVTGFVDGGNFSGSGNYTYSDGYLILTGVEIKVVSLTSTTLVLQIFPNEGNCTFYRK